MPVAFILARWKWIVGGLGLVAAVITVLVLKAEVRHWHKLYNNEHATLVQFKDDVRFAAEEAARQDKANVARVKTEQAAITERTVDEYKVKLADTASRYDRLRAQAAGYLSRPTPAELPATPDTTCLAVTGTSCENLPPLLKAAQDNTDQLIALQAWVQRQTAVDNNGEPK